MTQAARADEAACLQSLDTALADGRAPDLAGCSAAILDGALRELVKLRGARAAPLLRLLAETAPARDLRKTARLAIYRLSQAGVVVPPAPAVARSVVARHAERAVRAWLSGIDGSGSRAVWILFEGGLGGGLLLCSLILNDEAGILESAGGPITRKRLERELAGLREHQKLPWVEGDPVRACRLVADTLDLHGRLGTEPPATFSRWRRLFAAGSATPGTAAADGGTPAEVDAILLDRSAELVGLPELTGWFVDPAAVQEEALALLQARESRLVVSEQIRTEREAAIVEGAIDRLFTPDACRRWSRRLEEMALIFSATGRDEPARVANGTAAALGAAARAPRAIPFVRALVLRGLEMAGEVTLGRAKLSDVSRAPLRRPGA